MSSTTESTDRSWLERLYALTRRYRLAQRVAIALVVLAPLSGLVTYAVISEAVPFSAGPRLTLALIALNVILILALAGLVVSHIARLIIARRSGFAGSQLQLRLVTLFSIIAIAPAILVAIFSAITVDLGLETWFSEKVRKVVRDSVSVAEGYLNEHRQVIRADLLAMANDLNWAAPTYRQNPRRFNAEVEKQAMIRNLPGAYVIDSAGEILARGPLGFGVAFEPPPPDALQKAIEGDVVILNPDTENQVKALVRLTGFVDAYLYVGRFLDPVVIERMRSTQAAVSQYERLEGQRSGVRITFALIYLIFALLVLLAAVWIGLWFARRLAQPIGDLVAAAEQVTNGNLNVRVNEPAHSDEIGGLSRAFNRMTSQVLSQRNEIVEQQRQSDGRRRFIEAVLSGVSAGVIGLDTKGRIEVVNRSAHELLAVEPGGLIGRKLDDVVPELAKQVRSLLKAHGSDGKDGEQVHIVRGSQARELMVRVTRETGQHGPDGYVVTLDDMTNLVSAQRMAAWADVARRIAHEIKNPLTPIQLSAERLKRKYGRHVQDDRATFEQCTETIIRQVGDIQRMVDEFSAFARMPQPTMRPEDVTEIARQAIFLQQVGNPWITYGVIEPDEPLIVNCDGRLVSQALINLLKNAGEAISARRAEVDGSGFDGIIRVEVAPRAGGAAITVIDNGIGLPEALRNRLTEPYVTTRDRGTGLGLAIVQKIADEHGGNLTLGDSPDGRGASVTLFLPGVVASKDQSRATAERDAPQTTNETRMVRT